MNERIIKLGLSLIFCLGSLYAGAENIEFDNEGKVWAFLVASSKGYINYRHQADVCHAYQILHNNGIPDENIIVMMSDDIAYSSENPTPGVILNEPNGENVYEGVLKDYTNETVTPSNFLNILSGNKTAMAGIGSGRVIESGPNDYIFLNFVDHGGPGVLMFGSEDVLTAGDFVETLKRMSEENRFAKMFIYLEACHSGSLFDDILPDDLNIIVMTAADPHENSFACFYDSEREAYLSDVFSISWMHDTLRESLPAETMHHQFEKVRTWTNTSHVEEYGDLDIGSTKVMHFLGFRTTERALEISSGEGPQIMDIVSNVDVPLSMLDLKIENTKEEELRRKYKLQKHHMLKLRRMVDRVMERLVKYLSGDNNNRKLELLDVKYKLGHRNMDCYKKVLKRFSDRCFNVARHPYMRVHLSKLVNMCNLKWVTVNNALDAISAVCYVKQNLGTRIF